MSQHDPLLADISKSPEADPMTSIVPKKEELTGKKLKLYRAALRGDWEVAEPLFADFEEGIRLKISKYGDTALHIAAAAKRIDFVKKLVKKMNKDDLIMGNNNNCTALLFAATSGMVELAKEFMKNNNRKIATVRDKHQTLPIQMAAALGHRDMVKFLYKETKDCFNEEDLNNLFITSIETDLYDVALQLIADYPNLDIVHARAGDKGMEVTALHVLAVKANQHHRGNLFSGAKDVEKKKQQALELVERICDKLILLDDEEISHLIGCPRKLIFEAAERGNVEFLSLLIRGYPDLRWKFDNEVNNYSIFHYAVKYRREEVFNLIYEIGSSMEIFFETKDNDDNNVLHLAGMLAPSDRLNIVSGAALQMRRELQWFKKVQTVAQPRSAEARNKNRLTPRELFTKEHEDLRKNGEQWMKETAGSCMVVATLITTVAMAAAFTVPGGNNGDTGFPIFLENFSFMIFAISDAISLVSSSASVLNFLSILTSRYTEEDFLWLLPRKLCFGLITLFISIAAMMTVFSATFFIIFNHRRLWIAILVTIIASTPVIMFIWKYLQLFYDVLCSADVSGSLFPRGKSHLFREGREVSDQSRKSEILSSHFHTMCSRNV